MKRKLGLGVATSLLMSESPERLPSFVRRLSDNDKESEKERAKHPKKRPLAESSADDHPRGDRSTVHRHDRRVHRDQLRGYVGHHGWEEEVDDEGQDELNIT